MFTISIYILVGALVTVSLIRDKHRTITALRRGCKSFESILPLLLSLVLVIGITLAVLSPQMISHIIGERSGILGILAAAVIGSITLIPGFVTFPLAANLLKAGAGIVQIVVFISTSMMVGVVTIPVEIRYLGTKATIIRNSLALVFSFLIAAVMYQVLK